MANYSNVVLGAGFPGDSPSDEGKILGIKDDTYVAFPFISVINFADDEGDLKSDKTAGEILALANEGSILLARVANSETTIYQFVVTGIDLTEGTYTLMLLAPDASEMSGTSTDADDPIVISSGE